MNKMAPWNELLNHSLSSSNPTFNASMQSLDEQLLNEEQGNESFSSVTSSASRRPVVLVPSPGSKRTRTSYIPKGLTVKSKTKSEKNKSSVHASLFKFLEDDAAAATTTKDDKFLEFLKNDLILRASNHTETTTNTTGTATKKKKKPKTKSSGVRTVGDGEMLLQSEKESTKAKRRKSKKIKPVSESNSSSNSSSKPSSSTSSRASTSAVTTTKRASTSSARRGSEGTLATTTSTAPSSPVGKTQKRASDNDNNIEEEEEPTRRKSHSKSPVSKKKKKGKEGMKKEKSRRSLRSSNHLREEEDGESMASPVATPAPLATTTSMKSPSLPPRPPLTADTTAMTRSPTSPSPLTRSSSTESRVKAARQKLDISLHQGIPPESSHQQQQQRPMLQARLSGMSHNSGDNNSTNAAEQRRRETKERLAGLSFERQSMHERKNGNNEPLPSSSPTTGASGGKPPLLPPRKMKRGSRLAKMKKDQVVRQEEADQAETQGENNAISPSSLRGRSSLHNKSSHHESTTSNEAAREERRLAAKSQLEGISHVLEKRRSNSGSLELMETSLREKHDAALDESNSTMDMDETDHTTGMTNDGATSPGKSTLQKGIGVSSQVPSPRTQAKVASAIATTPSPERNIPSAEERQDDDASLGDNVKDILKVSSGGELCAENLPESSLKILQVFESSRHSLSTQEEGEDAEDMSDRFNVAAAVKPSSRKSLPMTDGSSRVSAETDGDVDSFAFSTHSSRWPDSQHTAAQTAANNVMLELSSPLKKQTGHPLLPPRAQSPKKKNKSNHGVDNISNHSIQKTSKSSRRSYLSEPSAVTKDSKAPSLPSKSRSIARTSSYQSSGSGSLRPKADLHGFLRHLAVLNDLKALTNPSPDEATNDPDALHRDSLLIRKQPGHGKNRRSRFQQMFQLKCTLLNILSEDSPEEAELKRKALSRQFDLDPSDLQFVLEHVELCQEENTEIRWDLVRTMFFPDDDDAFDSSRNFGAVNPPKSRSFMGYDSLPILDFHTSLAVGSKQARKWNSTTDFASYLHTSTAEISALGRSQDSFPFFQEDEECDEDGTYLSPREEYQEAILELYEEAESVMAELSFDERQARRLVLVHLLQATSEDEAHLTSLSLDDVAEIVHHVRICKETETEVQWDLIRDIVFPLGILEDPMLHQSHQNGLDEGTKRESSNTFHASFISVDNPEQHGVADVSQHKGLNDSFRAFFDLEEDELDVVLHHINMCNECDEPIRWDLIGDVLFPGDPIRQAMLSDRMVGEGDEGAANMIQSAHDAKQARKNAILKLSNHSDELMCHGGVDDSDAASFGAEDLA